MVIVQPIKNDHRWFIWTVMFLIVSGVSLVSYIMITSINESAATDTSFLMIHHSTKDKNTSK